MTIRTRRAPTPEQQEAAKARREALYKINKLVSSMTDEERLAFASKVNMTTCEGHTISPFNACMITRQREDTTIVGGLQQWRRAGRKVRKGEHGMGMFVPKHPSKEAEGEGAQPGELSLNPLRFIIVTMFDITQTEPEGLA